MTRRRKIVVKVLGPWSLETSRRFWEGFAPAELATHQHGGALQTVFRVASDWSVAEVHVTQQGSTASLTVSGDGDLDQAGAQACRFLSVDVDARGWPNIAQLDPVIADAQQRLPGFRPCGFHSPYEAAAWAVLSQRLRIVQAARLREDLVARHGHDGAFPAPDLLRILDLDLPGRKAEYLRAVADAALEGQLDGAALRSMEPDDALRTVQEINGLGPFAAELVVIRGANSLDILPRHDRRLEDELTVWYGPDHSLADVSEMWRPFRTWAAVNLRILREQRTHEISGHPAPRKS
jgi:DNA-3-methyladenine glycosylase II